VGVPIGPQVLFAPVILLMVMSAGLGIGIWAAALCVRYRDVAYIVPVAIQFLFFASPVAYSISVVHGKTGAFIYQLNPLSGMIGLWRWAVLGTPFPQVWTVWSAAGISIGLLLVGAMVFRRMERTFADVI
jgi:ABC-type polysaccharide/polyol phosphate export permease